MVGEKLAAVEQLRRDLALRGGLQLVEEVGDGNGPAVTGRGVQRDAQFDRIGTRGPDKGRREGRTEDDPPPVSSSPLQPSSRIAGIDRLERAETLEQNIRRDGGVAILIAAGDHRADRIDETRAGDLDGLSGGQFGESSATNRPRDVMSVTGWFPSGVARRLLLIPRCAGYSPVRQARQWAAWSDTIDLRPSMAPRRDGEAQARSWISGDAMAP